MLISIVIPCYNEASNIPELIKHICNINERSCSVEYIIVNNGSTDNSEDVFNVYRNAKLNKNVRFVTVPKNRGYGYGIKQGVKEACGEYVGWIHGDVQMYPEELEKFFLFLQEHEGENVLMKGKRSGRKVIEYIFTYGMGVVASLVFRKTMKEVMSMPVLTNKKLLHSELEDDFGIDIEVYYLAVRQNYNVVHLPVTIHERVGGVSSWNTGLLSRLKTSLKMFSTMKKIKKKYNIKGEK